ncbi:MAG: peroxiredoxin [Paracoccaceae bacterium]
MTISVGDRLPDSEFLIKRDGAPATLPVSEVFDGRRVVLFGVPGAFTPTCHAAHLPSFIRTARAFRGKGVDTIACVSVNDVHVMQMWGETTGAAAAGIVMLADAASAFTTAIGMDFDAPPVGMYRRSKRYSMLVEDRVVKILTVEEKRGVCEATAGETLLGRL